jgi:pSer/pThr/pTyr-binding forkhead associated (FHA) protein
MNPFLQACGAEGPLQLDVKDANRSTIGRWTLDQPYALIGRDPRADIVLDHDDVSRRHVYVQVITGRVFFVDLGSRNGVLRENQRQPAGWLSPGQTLEIGPFSLQIGTGSAGRSSTGPGETEPIDLDPLSERSSRAEPQPQPQSQSQPGVILQFRRSAWRIRRLLTLVGSGTSCKLRLNGPGVKPYHCSLVLTSEGMWVVDLKPRNGITVNGAHVSVARLGEGDLLEVAGYPFRLGAEAATVAGHSGLPALRAPDRPAPETATATAIELMPLRHPPLAEGNLTLAGAAAGRDLAPDLLLDQFASMQQQLLGVVQQQMSDQFHQVIQVMAHMFDTLHRDQSGLIRQEFERLRQITEEIQSLNAAAASPPPPPTPREARPAPASNLPLPPPSPVGPESEDVHAFIQARMGVLQRERQSRWQRLLELMIGRTGEVATP